MRHKNIYYKIYDFNMLSSMEQYYFIHEDYLNNIYNNFMETHMYICTSKYFAKKSYMYD